MKRNGAGYGEAAHGSGQARPGAPARCPMREQDVRLSRNSSFFPLLPFSGTAVPKGPFSAGMREISLFPRFFGLFSHRERSFPLLFSDEAPLFSISKVYTQPKPPLFSLSGARRFPREKNTVRPERTASLSLFSPFLPFSPFFTPIRKNRVRFLFLCPPRKGFPPSCELLIHNIHSRLSRHIPQKAPYFRTFPSCLFLSLRFIHSYSHFPVYISGGQRGKFRSFRRFSPFVKTLKNPLVNSCDQTCE